MTCRMSFHEAVDASFVASSEQGDEDDEKVLRKPGLEGLHSFFAECLTKAPHGGVNADGLPMELLERVFEEQGWDHDMSLKRTELEPFLESLGATGPEKRNTSDDMSQFITQYRERSISNKFPLVHPEDMTDADNRDVAGQTLLLTMDMDTDKIQHYINLKMQVDLEENLGDVAPPPQRKPSKVGVQELLQACMRLRGPQ